MAEINTESGGHKKGGSKAKPKKMSTRVDLTPMVDLAFLLVTFFMLTTTLSKPQTMEISMPAKTNTGETSKVRADKAMTVVLGKNDKVYYYFGTRDPKTNADPEVTMTDFSPEGIRKALLHRNDSVVKQMRALRKDLRDRKIKEDEFKKKSKKIKESKSAPIVIIKATDKSNYKNLVDILDEMQICSIARFAIVDIAPLDKELISKYEH
ncbi:MAG: biopolymer transporter ExbD [Bacteroidota bacterium]|nr:biopolymer transporter ExbD [Bacteroidota bacterium]